MSLHEIATEVSEKTIVSKQKVNKSTVLVLMGLQYIAKSYLTQQITKKNYAHFWATKIKKTYGVTNSEIVTVGLEEIEQVTSAGYNLVIDFVNHEYATRKQFQEIAYALIIDYQLVFIDTPKHERLQRREINMKTGDESGRRVISLEQMQEFENDFELPHDTEPTIILRT